MTSNTILVCGGAGYIGSHTCLELRDAGYNVIVLDNLSHGHRESISGFKLIVGDVRDSKILDEVFTTYKIDCVMHFCGLISVPESVQEPLEYLDNNFIGTLRILQAMKKHSCKMFIFSSTAAIFGNPERCPILEDDLQIPINPYGESKLFVEKLLYDCREFLKFVSFRYFNACGAHKSGSIGEYHEPETHLIPIVLQVPLGKREKISIFGNDYKTKDGTCIRDYIHVSDLALAHVKAIQYLKNGGKSDVFNLGSGQGFSVREVIEVCRKVTGHLIPEEIKPRREGDADVLVASSEKAEKILNWKREYVHLSDIVESAWNWHKSHPNGYNNF